MVAPSMAVAASLLVCLQSHSVKAMLHNWRQVTVAKGVSQTLLGRDISSRARDERFEASFAIRLLGGGNQEDGKHNFKKNEKKVTESLMLLIRGGHEAFTRPALASTKRPRRHRISLYSTCLLVVTLWVCTGTLVYSIMNKWPLPTAFFYAVDAGMSIGFCTDIAEHTIRSRAFSIIFILLGASVVGGALVLVVHDSMEGVITRTITTQYRNILERHVFQQADKDGDGKLTYGEFGTLLRQSTGQIFTSSQLMRLCHQLDPKSIGYITCDRFLNCSRYLDEWILADDGNDGSPLARLKVSLSALWESIESGPFLLYLVCFLWVTMGVVWGNMNQDWDLITATHFAISALATGGLTAPPVNSDGFLPKNVAIFVGLYCLWGIPLFYVTMSHFASNLVASHLVTAESRIIATPLQPLEFRVAKSLCSRDELVHLSDFIVLYFLRRGKTNIETIGLLKQQFDEFDTDNTGALTFEQATSLTSNDDTKKIS